MASRWSGWVVCVCMAAAAAAAEPSRRPYEVGVFRVDVTPPAGSPLCGGLVKPVARVAEPLLALGVVLVGDGQPIVLCAIDWCEIRAADHLAWRERLADAAGTTPDRVVVQSLHQHDAPIADAVAHRFLADASRPLPVIDAAWNDGVRGHVAAAVRDAARRTVPATHVSTGQADVDRVASNRRIYGEDGRVKAVRTSATKDPQVRAAPEGVIDPRLRTLTFWNEERGIVALSYYATHPMSHYGQGEVSADFVGIAREQRTRETGVPHVYFTGCGGNVTAGKYNDGAAHLRLELAARVHAAMVQSEESPRRIPLDRLGWDVRQVTLVPGESPADDDLRRTIGSPDASAAARITAAMHLSFRDQQRRRPTTLVPALRLNDRVAVVHLPGEPFVEYQLFAQSLRPDDWLAVAGYGDGGCGYIPLEASFAEGGYEPTVAFAVPGTEQAIKQAFRSLLE